MSTIADRLQRLHGVKKNRRKQPEPTLLPTIKEPIYYSSTRLEELVTGQEIQNEYGSCYLSTHTYPRHHLRGSSKLGDILNQHPKALKAFYPGFNLGDGIDFRQALFLDTETTGLGGGAGVYCFMVGLGSLEADEHDSSSLHFVTRQFFMRTPAEESALLVAVADYLNQKEMLITFNGRSFDIPLLRTRFSQNRQLLPDSYRQLPLLEPDAPHLDLLHPARKVWRRRLQSCRLSNLEDKILNIQRHGDDVPGHLIPRLYTQYIRSQNASEMKRVFYHNREDIISMVPLADYLCTLLSEKPSLQSIHQLAGLDWLALGICYEEAERWEEAEVAYQRALESVEHTEAKSEVFYRLGQLQKRQKHWQEATEIWQRWLSSVPGVEPTPYVELAKYCEWQIKDLEQAEMWAAWALHNQKTAPTWQQSPTTITELEYRLARLKRKRANPTE